MGHSNHEITLSISDKLGIYENRFRDFQYFPYPLTVNVDFQFLYSYAVYVLLLN